jgi:HD-GYP domain-containing protein (c-di-GMP phosphodiesterase class II)
MFQHFPINNQRELEEVRAVCEQVYVEYLPENLQAEPREAKPTPLELADSIDRVDEVMQRAHKTTQQLFDELRLTGSLDSDAARAVVDECMDAVLDNQDAVNWLMQMRRHDALAAQHALNCVALSLMLGAQEDMRESELRDLGLCALLHDVGKLQLPAALNRPGTPLSGQALKQYRQHTLLGRNTLLSTRNLYSGAADVAFSHHEHVDGSGFPRGLNHDKIPRYALIVAITDQYDNALHPRAPQAGADANAALRELYAARDTRFDAALVMRFIAAVGIYPPGSLVELDSGEVGIVLSNNSADRLRPRVIIILGANKLAVRQTVIDLLNDARDTDGTPFQIKHTLRDGSFGIHVEDFVRAGLRIEMEAATAQRDA